MIRRDSVLELGDARVYRKDRDALKFYQLGSRMIPEGLPAGTERHNNLTKDPEKPKDQ